MASTYQVHLPKDMASLLNKVSEASGVSSEDILLDWLLHPVPRPNDDNIDMLLEDLANYSDALLWTVVYRELGVQDSQRIDELNSKHEQGMTLSESEKEEQRKFSDIVDNYMLMRSQALVLLKERGFDVSHFFHPEKKYN